MPTYEYKCPAGHRFDVIKRIAELDREEACGDCQQVATRQLVRTHVHASAGDWNRQEFNPGLGCYTKSTKHARDIAKRRGLEEVGTEKPETIHAHFDKQREETRAERWREADREKLYED